MAKKAEKKAKKVKKVKKVIRRKEEFHCSTECGKYFLTNLRSNMNGAYTIQCPNTKCGHHHYRIIKDGLVTEDRKNSEKGHLDIIEGLVSTLQDTPHDLAKENLKIIVSQEERNAWLKEIAHA